MGFDAADFLAGLTGQQAAAEGIGPRPLAVDGPSATAEPIGNSAAAEAEPASRLFSDWVLRPDVSGRLGWEPPDLPEEARWWGRCDWEDLPRLPEPCPTCGGFERWWDILGRAHCQRCEKAVFERGRWLADRAARAREHIQQTAPPEPRGCVRGALAGV